MADRRITINNNLIKFKRVEAHWSEVYQKRKYNNEGLDAGELKNMERVSREIIVNIELDLPKSEWDNKSSYFVYFNGAVYKVIATNPDNAVIALIKTGFIGTQRFVDVPNHLYNDLLNNTYSLYRIQDVNNAQIIVHCYSNINTPTRVQYDIRDIHNKLVPLRDQLETYFIIRELGK